MQQIADWLNSIGLEQYAQRFAENDIDVSVLRHLTDADLEKIGVSLGHRRKMLAAIAELQGATPSRPEPVAGVELKPQNAAERRQAAGVLAALLFSVLYAFWIANLVAFNGEAARELAQFDQGQG